MERVADVLAGVEHLRRIGFLCRVDPEGQFVTAAGGIEVNFADDTVKRTSWIFGGSANAPRDDIAVHDGLRPTVVPKIIDDHHRREIRTTTTGVAVIDPHAKKTGNTFWAGIVPELDVEPEVVGIGSLILLNQPFDPLIIANRTECGVGLELVA